MLIKPKCMICDQIYMGGREGCCSKCLSGRPAQKRRIRLRCLCGRRAVAILLGDVVNGDGEPMLVEIPICPICQNQEIQLEASQARMSSGSEKNPVHLVIVKSLPRARFRFQGKKLC